ncbi:MAG: hypothetical protein HC837_11015 [Chloroflexaceae bacterium]|nr:hypothetical protein [Chloroflexaceae bacterium]
MMQTRESQSSQELRMLVRQEKRRDQRLSRMARATSTTDTFLGLLGGAALGILLSIALVSGFIPGFTSLAVFGPSLPILFGSFGAGVGILFGSFVDLHSIANIWRR